MRTTRVARAVLGVLWVVLAGTWLAIGYVVAAAVSAALPVSRAHARPALQMAGYTLWPFGVTLRAAPDVAQVDDPRGRAAWLVLAGWWLIVLHVATSLLLAVTLVGLPLALLDASLLSAAARPRGLLLHAWPAPGRPRPVLTTAAQRQPIAA